MGEDRVSLNPIQGIVLICFGRDAAFAGKRSAGHIPGADLTLVEKRRR